MTAAIPKDTSKSLRIRIFLFSLALTSLVPIPWAMLHLPRGEYERFAPMLSLWAINVGCYLVYRMGYRIAARVLWLALYCLALIAVVHFLGEQSSPEIDFFVMLALPFLLFSWTFEFRALALTLGIVVASSLLAFLHDLFPIRGLLFPIPEPHISNQAHNVFALRVTVMMLLVIEVGFFAKITSDAHKSAYRAARAAEQTSEDKSLFIANLGHEVRTPISGIIGLAELIDMETLDTQQQRAIQGIRRSSDALLQMVNDILDGSQLESDSIKIDECEFELVPLLEQVALSLQPMADDNQVKIGLSVLPTVPEVIDTDPIRLRQIVTNLMSNAIKYASPRLSGREGSVELQVEVEGGRTLKLSVKDNGVGMSETVYSEAFKPFAAGRADQRRLVGGTGLGLSIVQSLVELFDGRVSVFSREGVGTTVEVQIPLKRVAEADNWLTSEVRSFVLSNVDSQAERSFFQALAELKGVDVVFDAGSSMLVGDAVTVFVFPEVARAEGVKFLKQNPQAKVILLTTNRATANGFDLQGSYVLQSSPIIRSDFKDAVSALSRDKETWVSDKSIALSEEGANDDDLYLPQGFSAIRTLVVEDNAINQQVLSAQLNLLDVAHDVASNGVDGLKLWNNNEYHLVFSDIQMPVMDGLQMAEGIRTAEELAPGPSCRIVGLSASVLQSDIDQCKQAGMDDVIEKPIRIRELRNQVLKCHNAASR